MYEALRLGCVGRDPMQDSINICDTSKPRCFIDCKYVFYICDTPDSRFDFKITDVALNSELSHTFLWVLVQLESRGCTSKLIAIPDQMFALHLGQSVLEGVGVCMICGRDCRPGQSPTKLLCKLIVDDSCCSSVLQETKTRAMISCTRGGISSRIEIEEIPWA